MVFCHPEAPVAEPLRVTGKLSRIPKRLTGVATFDDRSEVENGKWDHARPNGRARGQFKRIARAQPSDARFRLVSAAFCAFSSRLLSRLSGAMIHKVAIVTRVSTTATS